MNSNEESIFIELELLALLNRFVQTKIVSKTDGSVNMFNAKIKFLQPSLHMTTSQYVEIENVGKILNCSTFAITNGTIYGSNGIEDANKTQLKTGKFLLRLFFALGLHYVNHSTGIVTTESCDSLPENEVNAIIEAYINYIKSKVVVIEIQESNEVSEVYRRPLARETSTVKLGTLKNSCMRAGADYKCKFGAIWFDMDPDINIAYIADAHGHLIARALIWHNVSTSAGNITFLDRIYGDATNALLLKKHAIDKGWYVRNDSCVLELPGKPSIHQYEKTLPHNIVFQHMPYFDTFKKWSRKGNSILSDNTSVSYALGHPGTSGFGKRCSVCDQRMERFSLVNGKATCHQCSWYSQALNTSFFHSIEKVYSKSLQSFIPKSQAQQDADTGDFRLI